MTPLGLETCETIDIQAQWSSFIKKWNSEVEAAKKVSGVIPNDEYYRGKPFTVELDATLPVAQVQIWDKGSAKTYYLPVVSVSHIIYQTEESWESSFDSRYFYGMKEVAITPDGACYPIINEELSTVSLMATIDGKRGRFPITKGSEEIGFVVSEGNGTGSQVNRVKFFGITEIGIGNLGKVMAGKVIE